MPAIESLTSALISLKGSYMFGMHEAKDKDLFKKFAAEAPSAGAENIYSWLGNMEDMREWIGDRIFHQLDGEEYRVPNKKFELSVEIDEDKYEDNQLGTYAGAFQAMGEKVAQLPTKLCMDVLNQGKTLLCFDKQPLFDTDHPTKDGVLSNYRTGASEPWILIDPTRKFGRPVIYQPRRKTRFTRKDRPGDHSMFLNGKMQWGADRRDGAAPGLWQTALLSEEALNATNFATAFAQMAAFKNDAGHKMGITPKLLITTSDNWSAVDALFNKTHLAGGETNTHAGRVEVIFNDRLSIV